MILCYYYPLKFRYADAAGPSYEAFIQCIYQDLVSYYPVHYFDTLIKGSLASTGFLSIHVSSSGTWDVGRPMPFQQM